MSTVIEERVRATVALVCISRSTSNSWPTVMSLCYTTSLNSALSALAAPQIKRRAITDNEIFNGFFMIKPP